MGMEDIVLLGGFAAIAIFGYYIMVKLDNFLDKVRRENEDWCCILFTNSAARGRKFML